MIKIIWLSITICLRWFCTTLNSIAILHLSKSCRIILSVVGCSHAGEFTASVTWPLFVYIQITKWRLIPGELITSLMIARLSPEPIPWDFLAAEREDGWVEHPPSSCWACRLNCCDEIYNSSLNPLTACRPAFTGLCGKQRILFHWQMTV